MNLKYLLVPVIAFALGILSPVTLAKGHGKSHGGHEGKVHGKQKHEKHEKHQKHEKKHYNVNSNKQSDDGSTRSLERADNRHHKFKHKKHDCDKKNCVVPHPTTVVVPATLPHPPGTVNINVSVPTLPKVNVNVPAVPKVNVSTPALPKVNVPTPQNPVDNLIDQTANEAKQKAREIGQ